MPDEPDDLHQRNGHSEGEPEKPRKKGRQTTRQEIEKRIDTVVKLLNTSRYKSEIKRIMMATWGITHWTCEDYFRRARERMEEHAELPKRTEKARSYRLYDKLARDEEMDPNIRLKAQERIDKLKGLEEPARIAHSQDGKKPFYEEQEEMYADDVMMAHSAAMDMRLAEKHDQED